MCKKICMVYGIKISFSKWLTKTNICNCQSDPRENLSSDDDFDLGKFPDRVDITFSEIIFHTRCHYRPGFPAEICEEI